VHPLTDEIGAVPAVVVYQDDFKIIKPGIKMEQGVA
jgi:hypothetical protein